MRKILSVLLVLCMIMTLAPAAAITSFAEEVLEIPVIGEISEEDLVEIYGEGEVELLANVTAAFVPAEGDGVTYFSEFDGESITNVGNLEGSPAALVDGKYTTNDEESIRDDNGILTGMLGRINENVITVDMGAAKTFSGIRIYDSSRARFLDARKIKTLSLSVSDDGVLWYALDNATNEDFTSTYRDFAFKKNSAAVNVTARYFKFVVTAVNRWEWEAEEIVLIDEIDENDTLTADDFGATNVENVTAHTYTITDGDGVTYLTELDGAAVTVKSGGSQGNVTSTYNGIYTTGVKVDGGSASDNNHYPIIGGITEGFMGTLSTTILTVDLGSVQTFSGIRLADDHKGRAMKARKASTVSGIKVSEDGEAWGNLDNMTITRTAAYEPQYGDFAFSFEGNKANITARYIEFTVSAAAVSGGSAHGEFQIEEIIMLDADEDLNTITQEEYDPTAAEAARDYYCQKEWFTAQSMDTGDSKPIGNLFDGYWQPEDHPLQANGGDNGKYWHSNTGLTADKRGVVITFNEAQKIGGFRFYPRIDNPGGNPRYVTIFASTDGTSFDKILDHAFVMNSTNKKPVVIEAQTGVAYKAVKVQIDENASGNTNNHAAFCELQVLKPKKGYAYEEDVIQFTTTPAVTSAGSTTDTLGRDTSHMDADSGLFDKVVYQFINEEDGYYNLWTGTPSSDPHFEMNHRGLTTDGNTAWAVIDFGAEYTFSAARVFGRWNQPSQGITEAILYVSDNGTDWVALDKYSDTGTNVNKSFDASIVKNSTGAATTDVANGKYNSTGDIYTEIPVKVKGGAYNVTARYIKIEAVKTSGNHWSMQELLLVKEDDGNETKTVTELKEISTGVVEDGLDYYNPSVYFESVVAGSEWNSGSPVTEAFDGITDNVGEWHETSGEYPSDDNCNYWHSAASGTITEAQRTITVMFKNPIKVGGFRVYGRHDSTTNVRQYGANPGTIRIEATYDGENWFKATGSLKTALTAGADSDLTTDDGVWQGTNLLNGELDNKFKGIRYVVEKGVSGSSTAHTNIVELQILKATTYESPFEADDFTAYPVWAITAETDTPADRKWNNGNNSPSMGTANLNLLTDGVISKRGNIKPHWEANGVIYPAPATGDPSKAWITIDLGAEQTFSGIRVYPRRNGEGGVWASQTISKGSLYVSDNGTDWVQADLSTDLNTTTGIFNAKALADGEVRNIKARYVRLEANQMGRDDTHEHWSATELRLIKPVSGKETLTVTAFAELFKEEVFEGYYTNAADWTWTAGSQYSQSHGVGNLYDGKVYGNMGACWHSAVDGDKSVTIMFDKETAVGGVRVFPRTVNGGASANVIKMQGTYDGTTWVDILPDTTLGFTSGSKEEYKEAYLMQGRNNTFKGIKFIVVKGIDGNSSYTNITELQVLLPVAPKVTFPDDEVEMGYPLGTAATYIVKAGSADTVKHGTDRGKIIMDGDYITRDEFISLGAPDGGVSSRQLHHDFCIGAKESTPYNGDSVYLKYDLGKVYEFSGIRLYQRVSGDQNFKEGYIYVSEDGENWISSDKITVSPAVISAIPEVKFGGTAYNVKARYIKIHCTVSQSKHWALEEVRLLSPAADVDTLTPTEITAALVAQAEAVETLINAIGTVTLESKEAIKAARTAYDALAPALQATVDNYAVLEAAEAAWLALAGAELNDMIAELPASEVTADDADAVSELREIYEALSDTDKATINIADLEKAEAALAGLERTIDPTVNASGKLGYATLDYKLYTSANDVTVTGIKYNGEEVANTADEWKAVVNGDGTVTLTLGGNYYKSESHRHWLYSSTLASIDSHQKGGNYYKFRTANADLGIQVGDEVTENTYNGFFVRDITNNGPGKHVIEVSLSDGSKKEIVLNANYTWSSVSGGLSANDPNGILPTEWQVTGNGGASLAHIAANWFDGDYNDATNSNSYTAQYYDDTGAEKGTQHFARAAGPYKVWVDFGKATKFAGVKLNDKNYNLTNIKLYGSDDLVSWTYLGGISGNNSKTAQVDLEDNANYRYARIDIDEFQRMKDHSFLFLNEIVFLEGSTRIVGGDINVDLSAEITDIERKFNSDNTYAVTGVKVGSETITADTDYVLNGTTGITFKASYLGSLEVGEYEAEISFESGETAKVKLNVKDLSVAEYWLTSGADYNGSGTLTLVNATGKTAKSVSVGTTAVEFSQNPTEITVLRYHFKPAADVFAKLSADETVGYEQPVTVTFEDNTTKEYTVKIYAQWYQVSSDVTTTFLADEVVTGATWKVRNNAARPGLHPVNTFVKAAYNTQHAQNYHGAYTSVNGSATPDIKNHYIDVDMGTDVKEVGGIRYQSRANGADWSNVTISGSDDYETWTTLYTGKAAGAAGAYVMKFDQNSTFRYIRINITGANYPTADTIHFIKPALTITGEAEFKKDINANDEEIEISIEDLGEATISKVVLGTITLTASDYVYDAEEETILIKAAALNRITTEGDVTLAIETSAGKVGAITVKYMDFSKKLFPQEVTPYHFEHEVYAIKGTTSEGGTAMAAASDRKITTKSDGTELKNTDYAHTALTHSPYVHVYSTNGSSANWNSAPGAYEIDYKIPHKFSAVRVYHRVWGDGGVRQYFTTMREGYIEVSNDGINWLKSDLQTFGAGNLDSLKYNRNAYDDIKFIVNGVPMNVEARYVRVYPTKNGAWEPIGIEEICLYEPQNANAELNAAVITPNAPIYSLATMEDLVLDVEWNDYLTLDSISLKVDDELIPIAKGYYSGDEDTITISKYFFIDGGYDAGDVINLAVIGAVGSPLDLTVTVADAEEYVINYEAGENGTLKAVVRTTDMITGEAVETVIASGDMVGRHENLVFVAEGNEGYEAKEWTLTGKGEDTVTYSVVTDKKGWEFDAINAMEPVSKAFDGDVNTYWHSDYDVKYNPATGKNDLTIPKVDINEESYWITAMFDEPMMISELSHTCRLNADGTVYGGYGQSVKDYKIWSLNAEGEKDVLLAEGAFTKDSPTQTVALADAGMINGIELEILSLYGAHCSIGEIVFTEKVITEHHLTGGVTYTGSASSEFEIDDLFGNATVSVEFAPVGKGTAKITTDLKRLDVEIEETKVTFGENAELTLVPDEGEELPEEITVTMAGAELKAGQDYTYDSATGAVVVKNVKGDIKVLAVAKDVAVYTVTYEDAHGATGSLPEAGLYTEGDTFKLPTSKLKLAGSKFVGWECSADGEIYDEGDRFTMVAEDVTFYATWEAKESEGDDEGTKRPSLGGGGGGGASSGTGAIGGGIGTGTAATRVAVNVAGTTSQVAIGTVLADPTAPEGQEFIGWFLDAALTVPYANTGVIQNITVYPGFRKIRNASELKDMQGHWAEKTVGEMYVAYLVNGTADGNFEPDKKITRAEFCQILYLMSGQTTDGAHNFTDVAVGDWFAGAVAWAVKSGITNGTSETTFAPYENITREQMATMIYRYATLMGHDWTISKEAGFADQFDVATYANYQVNWAADKGIINGYPDGTFAPKSNATKAEAVTMLQRLLNLGK